MGMLEMWVRMASWHCEVNRGRVRTAHREWSETQRVQTMPNRSSSRYRTRDPSQCLLCSLVKVTKADLGIMELNGALRTDEDSLILKHLYADQRSSPPVLSVSIRDVAGINVTMPASLLLKAGRL
jgi:hypothetical protein